MQLTQEEIMKKSTMTVFKCHLIMIFVTFLLMFFLSSSKWFVIAFYTFITVSYGFLLYSESLMAARRDFYNANGDMKKVDLKFGFKIGFRAHILSLALLLAELVFYLVCMLSNHMEMFTDNPMRFWMFPFFGFFPNVGTYQWLTFLVYLIMCFFPCIVCGICYYIGIRQCKTKNN